MGDNAELSAHYYDPVPLHSVLIRLQNQVKLRQIESEDYDAALKSVEAMMLIDPNEYRLLLDAGVLYAKTGKQADAVEALEDYISKAPDARDRQEAAILLQDVKDAIKESTS